MKIIYCINGLFNSGGMERILTNKVNYLVENFNYDITIITTDQKNREVFYPLNKKVKHIDLGLNYTDDLGKNFFKRIYIYIRKQIKHRKLLKKFFIELKPNIIISLGNHETFFLPEIVDKNIKTIREHHFNKNFRLQELSQNFLYKLKFFYDNYREEKSLKKYDEFIVLTNEDKKLWKNSKVKVIPNFSNYISNKVSKCNNRKLISVGRLSYEKGYDILIDVWNLISRKYPDWTLEIYGEGKEREGLQNKINKLGLENSFLLKGTVKNIQDKYLESSIYVMTSRYEGFGMVIIEAMSCGLPIISFDCPYGPKNIITDNEDGFVVQFENIKQMAERVEELIVNEEKRRLFGKRAKENVQRFSQDKIMEQWNRIFIELIKNNNRL